MKLFLGPSRWYEGRYAIMQYVDDENEGVQTRSIFGTTCDLISHYVIRGSALCHLITPRGKVRHVNFDTP